MKMILKGASSLLITILICGCDVNSVYEDNMKKANIEVCEMKMKSIEVFLASYWLFGGSYPTNEQGLDVLIEKPTTDPLPKRWRQQAKDLPLDPWGNKYIYEVFPTHFELKSTGEDLSDSSDDISIRCEFYKKK